MCSSDLNQRTAIDDMIRRCGFDNVSCGTVHSFQGDEKDTVVFSLALTDRTHPKTYEWLANNRELVNVATSRAKDKLVVVGSSDELERLHATIDGPDDLYELVGYVRSNGATQVQPRSYASRALGVKPYSTATEAAFLETLDHALGNLFLGGRKHVVHKEVGISHVFGSGVVEPSLFFSGRFDFVVYERGEDGSELPVLAIELDGAEHRSDEAVRAAREASALPILYKDFVTTGYQILRARAAGADAVLLVVAALADGELARLLSQTRSLGMEALVETHSQEEIARAVAAGAEIVGVNARDLRTFRTNPGMVAELLGKIPPGIVKIAESGIASAEDIRALRAAGADGFLVGEALMRAERPGEKLKELTGAADAPTA